MLSAYTVLSRLPFVINGATTLTFYSFPLYDIEMLRKLYISRTSATELNGSRFRLTNSGQLRMSHTRPVCKCFQLPSSWASLTNVDSIPQWAFTLRESDGTGVLVAPFKTFPQCLPFPPVLILEGSACQGSSVFYMLSFPSTGMPAAACSSIATLTFFHCW